MAERSILDADGNVFRADLLVEEARGRLSGYEGALLTYNAPVPRHGRLICAGLPLHAAVLAGRTSQPFLHTPLEKP